MFTICFDPLINYQKRNVSQNITSHWIQIQSTRSSRAHLVRDSSVIVFCSYWIDEMFRQNIKQNNNENRRKFEQCRPKNAAKLFVLSSHSIPMRIWLNLLFFGKFLIRFCLKIKLTLNKFNFYILQNKEAVIIWICKFAKIKCH